MNPKVDAYIEASQQWPAEMAALRPILLGCGLDEELKWRKPCYSHAGKNVAIIQEMKEFLALMFFKGALLDDAEGVLEDQGPNSRSARRVRFTSVGDVEQRADAVRALVDQAKAVEDSGAEVGPPPELVLVEELRDHLDRDPALKAAFDSLTPGRRREYNLYFASPKQAKTRQARVERYLEKILAGKGLRER